MDATKFVIDVGGQPVDLTDLLPLTLGDKKKLKAEGVNLGSMRELAPEDEAKFVLYILRKKRPEATLEEVDALPMTISSAILQHAVQKTAEVETPFSKRSTSSAASTGGQSAN